MPIWLIRTRDSEGNTEFIKVRAESAAGAVGLADVDLSLVYSIKNEIGTGRGKNERLLGHIQTAALAAGSFFFCGVIWLGSDETLISWSDTNSLGRALIIGFGVLIALAIVGGIVFRVFRFVKRRKVARCAEQAEAAEVITRTSKSAEAAKDLLDHPALRVGCLVIAIGMGIGVIVQLARGDAPEPFWIVMPLLILWSAACPPFSELS